MVDKLQSKYTSYYISYINILMIDKRFSPEKRMDIRIKQYRSHSDLPISKLFSDWGLTGKWRGKGGSYNE